MMPKAWAPPGPLHKRFAQQTGMSIGVFRSRCRSRAHHAPLWLEPFFARPADTPSPKGVVSAAPQPCAHAGRGRGGGSLSPVLGGAVGARSEVGMRFA